MYLLHLEVNTPHGEIAGRIFSHQMRIVPQIVSTVQKKKPTHLQVQWNPSIYMQLITWCLDLCKLYTCSHTCFYTHSIVITLLLHDSTCTAGYTHVYIYTHTPQFSGQKGIHISMLEKSHNHQPCIVVFHHSKFLHLFLVFVHERHHFLVFFVLCLLSLWFPLVYYLTEKKSKKQQQLRVERAEGRR